MIIERKEYLNKLITWKDKQLIKIVTGGKTMWEISTFKNVSRLFKK